MKPATLALAKLASMAAAARLLAPEPPAACIHFPRLEEVRVVFGSLAHGEHYRVTVPLWQTKCGNCGASGPYAPTPDAALALYTASLIKPAPAVR